MSGADSDSDRTHERERCLVVLHNALIDGEWQARTVFEALLSLATHCWFLMCDGEDDDTARGDLAQVLREFADSIEAGQGRRFVDVGQPLH